MHFRFLPLRRRFCFFVAAAALATLTLALSASANVALTRIAVDPFTNSTSQHKTIVEPDTYSFGSTIVAAAQSGRFFNGGASGIAWATSSNSGVSWTSGVLPGITGFTSPAGPYARVSDPSVAFDARHNVWIVSSLALNSTPSGVAVIVNRSTTGGTSWGNPVTVHAAGAGEDLDKNWTVCDNTSTSASISSHTVAGSLRTGPLPTAEIDGAGRIFVAWQDCRFRSGCSQNDIVYVTST